MKTAEWITNNLIFLCYMVNRDMINYNGGQLFTFFWNHFPKASCEDAARASLIKVLRLKGVCILRLKVQSVIYCHVVLTI